MDGDDDDDGDEADDDDGDDADYDHGDVALSLMLSISYAALIPGLFCKCNVKPVFIRIRISAN